MVGVARKNGKTGIAAGLALYGLTAEGDGAEVYSCAADRDQAKLVFSAAKRMVEMDAELSKVCKLYRDVIEFPTGGSIYRALSSEAYTKEGLSPSLVIMDELHALPDRDLYDVMSLAMGARVDPLMVIVTTAGVRFDRSGKDSIAYQLYQLGKRIATGEVVDPTYYMAWWEPTDSNAPPTDRAAWQQANPSLGDILDPADMASALPPATPENEYRTKRLNQWVVSSTAALPAGLFEARKVTRTVRPDEPVVLFFDGSFNHDCTALLGVTVEAVPHLFVVDVWERPPDNADWRVDIADVDRVVRETCRDFNVTELACDPFRWAQPMQQWEAAGLPVLEYPTTSPARMVPAWAKFYDAVIGDGLTHDGDPRLVRHVGNMALKTDRLGPRPVKEHRGSHNLIDLGICAVGGFDRATWHATQPVAFRSAYESEGLTFSTN